MNSYTKHILVGLSVTVLLLPAAAFAEPNNETQTKIQAIEAQIQMLQNQLKELMTSNTSTSASSTPSHEDNMMPPGQIGKMNCVTIARNLSVGARGDDVRSIQELLAHDSESGFVGTSTGFFGPMTAQAMMRFQKMHGIASSTDGSVGPMTRSFFERECHTTTATSTITHD